MGKTRRLLFFAELQFEKSLHIASRLFLLLKSQFDSWRGISDAIKLFEPVRCFAAMVFGGHGGWLWFVVSRNLPVFGYNRFTKAFLMRPPFTWHLGRIHHMSVASKACPFTSTGLLVTQVFILRVFDEVVSCHRKSSIPLHPHNVKEYFINSKTASFTSRKRKTLYASFEACV